MEEIRLPLFQHQQAVQVHRHIQGKFIISLVHLLKYSSELSRKKENENI